ncbi:MAG: twin-arginine translocase TatA/TatE family subunit [Actinomycetota bacterium]
MVAYSVGPLEIAIVVGIIILFFGAKKLPELARSIGRSSSEFKKGMSEGESETDVAGTNDTGEPRAEHKAETTE